MMANKQDSTPAQVNFPAQRGWTSLFIAMTLGTGLWSIALPWLSQRPAVAEHIEQLRAKNIDPSARYYSDLETLPPIVHRLERLHTTNHDKFWGR